MMLLPLIKILPPAVAIPPVILVGGMVVTIGIVVEVTLSPFLQLKAIIRGKLMNVSLGKRDEGNSFIIVELVLYK